MKTKRLGITVLLSVATLSWAPSPASAHVADVCTGFGLMDVSSRLYYPGVFGPNASGAVASFAFSVGGCLFHGGSPLVLFSLGNGVLPAPFAGAWCGAANGGGSLAGHGFSMTWVGKTMVLAGSVTGTFWVEEHPNNSCVSGAAVFLVSGAVYVSP